jgi:Flp pilus assembly CpaF family ATPase
MSTGHANSAGDMLARLEIMILMGMDLPLPAIRGQIASEQKNYQFFDFCNKIRRTLYL